MFCFLGKLQGINILPCTDGGTAEIIAAARNVILDATPPLYQLEDVVPHVTLGRNPHRWLGHFTRRDNQYDSGCQFLASLKRDFKRLCPQGSEIRTVSLINIQGNQRITVEFLVNCYCANNLRRRRRDIRCYSFGYTPEIWHCP